MTSTFVNSVLLLRCSRPNKDFVPVPSPT